MQSIGIFKYIKDGSDNYLPKITNFFVSFEWKMLNMLFFIYVRASDTSTKSFSKIEEELFLVAGTRQTKGRNLVWFGM